MKKMQEFIVQHKKIWKTKKTVSPLHVFAILHLVQGQGT
jgi:hypothetical protein